MRKDAERHRVRLIEAARKVFSNGGCAVPLELILEETGLGRGTLYRHFKTRADIIVAVLDAGLERAIAFVDGHRKEPLLLRDFLRIYAANGLMAVSAMKTLGNDATTKLLEPLQDRASRLCQTVIDDAIDVGLVAPTFDYEDLHLLMRMVIAAASEETSEERRSIMIDLGLDIVFAGLSSLGKVRSAAAESWTAAR